jgi:hypothetical protein
MILLGQLAGALPFHYSRKQQKIQWFRMKNVKKTEGARKGKKGEKRSKEGTRPPTTRNAEKKG